MPDCNYLLGVVMETTSFLANESIGRIVKVLSEFDPACYSEILALVADGALVLPAAPDMPMQIHVSEAGMVTKRAVVDGVAQSELIVTMV